MSAIHGFVKPGFERVAETFQAQAEQNEPGGSSVAVFIDGSPAINLWQGLARDGSPWTEQTVSNVFSCTKGVVATVCAHLVSLGQLNLEAPVTNYWPEFAQNGKAEIKVKTVLQHRAGLSATRRAMTYDQIVDGHSLSAELAEQEPLWQPDSTWGYHALTYGTLASRIIQGATGRTVGQYLAENISPKLNLPLWIGLPAQKLDIVAPLISDGNFISANAPEFSDGYWLERAMTLGGGLPVDPTDKNGFNDPRTLAAELPGANGVTNAFGLAKLYSALVSHTDGVRLANDSVLAEMTKPASTGANAFSEPAPNPVWGTGFLLRKPGFIEAPGDDGFGHNGLGGQSGWASLKHRLGFGYTTTYLKNSPEVQKNQEELVMALNSILNS